MQPMETACSKLHIINNILNRQSFTIKITESDKELRIRCITKAQQEVHLISCMKIDTTIEEWNKLKQPGTYETELADTAVVAVARAIHKDILVFNTNNVISNSPIYVIDAEEYPKNTSI